MALDAHRRLWFVDRATSKLKVVEPRCTDEKACINRYGGSPWSMSCEAPLGSDGRTLYESLQEKNVANWGYSVLDMGGCARSFYLGCPGGEEASRPICKAEGGDLADACVTWTPDGPFCTCDRSCRKASTFAEKVRQLFYGDFAIWFILAGLGGLCGMLALCCSLGLICVARGRTRSDKVDEDEDAKEAMQKTEGPEAC
jgi:hypothetical protein